MRYDEAPELYFEWTDRQEQGAEQKSEEFRLSLEQMHKLAETLSKNGLNNNILELESEYDILVSYGDIIYGEEILKKIVDSTEDMSVIVDDGWFEYWSERCENPLDDAETLIFDENDYLMEIGQKTTDLSKVQSQYIGLMRFKGRGLEAVLNISAEAKRRSEAGESLWRTV